MLIKKMFQDGEFLNYKKIDKNNYLIKDVIEKPSN